MRGKLAKLEMVRGFASVYVFAGHLLVGHVVNRSGLAAFLLKFGQEAVISFFLISGFVIYYSHHRHHDHRFRTYLLRRLRRTIPIFLLALGVAGLIAAIDGHVHMSWGNFLGNLPMLQDFSSGKPGVWVTPFADNVPLWSLSYEWWFYMMFFPIYARVAPRYQLPLVALLSLGGLLTYARWPNQISLFLLYFILWWTGLELARTYCEKKPTFSDPAPLDSRPSRVLCAGARRAADLHAAAAAPFLWIPSHSRNPPLCGRLSPLMWGADVVRCRVEGLPAPIRRFRRLCANLVYAIYVFHFPLVEHPAYLSWLSHPVLKVTVEIALVLLLSYVAEVPLQRASACFTRRKQRE